MTPNEHAKIVLNTVKKRSAGSLTIRVNDIKRICQAAERQVEDKSAPRSLCLTKQYVWPDEITTLQRKPEYYCPLFSASNHNIRALQVSRSWSDLCWPLKQCLSHLCFAPLKQLLRRSVPVLGARFSGGRNLKWAGVSCVACNVWWLVQLSRRRPALPPPSVVDPLLVWIDWWRAVLVNWETARLTK